MNTRRALNGGASCVFWRGTYVHRRAQYRSRIKRIDFPAKSCPIPSIIDRNRPRTETSENVKFLYDTSETTIWGLNINDMESDK